MRLLHLDSWRHFMANLAGDGGGGGDDGGGLPGPSPGDQYRAQMLPPPAPPYNPGPPPGNSFSGSRSSGPGPTPPPKPPPDIFANFPGPQVDQAKQVVQQFLALMGFPQNVDANNLTLDVLQRDLQGRAMDAYQYLFYNRMDASLRDTHPWAQFGMGADDYTSRKQSLGSMFESLIGQDLSPAGRFADDPGSPLGHLFYQAFKNNLSQSQVMTRLQTDPTFAQLLQNQPWLVQGQGFQQASQTFHSIYGAAPVDTGTLAAWFRFNTGTTQLNRAGREAITGAAPLSSPAVTR